MSYVNMSTCAASIRKVEYRAEHMLRYGKNEQCEDMIEAAVWLRFGGDGELSLSLSIDEARTLFYGLGVALVEHAVAEADPRGAWAVA